MTTQPPHVIDVVIEPDGEIKATVNGVQGSACEGLTDFLDDVGQVVEHVRTADFYRQPIVPARRNLTTGR
jgi:hypothetical protein